MQLNIRFPDNLPFLHPTKPVDFKSQALFQFIWPTFKIKQGENKKYYFKIPKNIFWSDGTPLQEKEYLKGILFILNKKNINNELIDIKSNSEEIILTSKSDLNFSMINFQPLKEDFSDVSYMSYGPYTIENWNKPNYLLLRKNPYFDSCSHHFNKIKIYFISDPKTAIRKYFDGKIDFSDLTERTYSEINSEGLFKSKLNYASTQWLKLNPDKFQDETANNYLLGLLPFKLINELYANQASRNNPGLIHPKNLIEPTSTSSYPKNFSVCINEVNSTRLELANLIISTWKQQGIDCKIKLYKWLDFVNCIKNKDFDSYIISDSSRDLQETQYQSLLSLHKNSYWISRFENLKFERNSWDSLFSILLTLTNKVELS